LETFIARVRLATELPLAVGFGIGTPAQARRVAQVADGVIVGSALVEAIGGSATPVDAARAFVAELRAALEPTQGRTE
jgi:tryptophan synthase alpha chain